MMEPTFKEKQFVVHKTSRARGTVIKCETRYDKFYGVRELVTVFWHQSRVKAEIPAKELREID